MNTHRRSYIFLLACLALGVPGLRAHDEGDPAVRAQGVERAAREMATAAQQFLAALAPEQQARARFDFADAERENFHFIPRARKGLPFKDLTPAQTHLAVALLSSGLSNRGLVKASTIMSLEHILLEIEKGSGPVRDPSMYFVSLFGQPGPKETWGWRVEGHHLSINFTIVKGREVNATPTFFGTNPAEVRTGPRQGLRVLAAEEDLGRALVMSFNETDRRIVIFQAQAPNDILTGAAKRVKPLAPAGFPFSKMNAEQRSLLQQLVREYVERHRPELAASDLARIQAAGWDTVHFAWAGGLEKGQGHYYRVQGPTFVMEYDNTQNNANHIHSVWRDFANDFGGDLLRKHYEESHRAP